MRNLPLVEKSARAAQGDNVSSGFWHRFPDQFALAPARSQDDVIWRTRTVGEGGQDGEDRLGGLPQVTGFDICDRVCRVSIEFLFVSVDEANGRVIQLAERKVIAIAVFAIDRVLHDQVQIEAIVEADEISHTRQTARNGTFVGPGGKHAQFAIVNQPVSIVHIADGIHIDHAD